MRKLISIILLGSILFFFGYFIYTEVNKDEPNIIETNNIFFVILEDLKLKEEKDYKYINNQIFFSVDFVKNYFDKDIYYDEQESMLIITAENTVYRFKPEQGYGTSNNKEIQLITPLSITGETLYIPYDLLKELYREIIDFNWNDNSLVIDYKHYEYLEGVLINDAKLSISPHEKSPFFGEVLLLESEKVIVFAEESSWFKIRTVDGQIGYINNDNLMIDYSKERFKIKNEIDDTSVKEELINLTWDYTYGPMRNIESVEKMPGVNIVAPTWFDIIDSKGTIYDKGNLNYSRLYRKSGYEVWPAVTNSFEPTLTKELLRSSATREKLIIDLINIYNYYEVDGINIDFENIYYDDKDYLTQFVRELYPVFKENGLKVSMDVSPRSTNPYWSMVYDRKKLQESLDYMMLMAYDQHWASSPVAGSVAQYSWVEESISRVLEQVPSHKLVLGMPFYSRVWDVSDSGVISQAVTMKTAFDFIEKNNIETIWDESSKQFYGEVKVGEVTRKIWLEDENSLYYKTSLVHKYNLAGIATWRKGFEVESIWESLDDYIS